MCGVSGKKIKINKGVSTFIREMRSDFHFGWKNQNIHTVDKKMARNVRKMGVTYCHSFILRV